MSPIVIGAVVIGSLYVIQRVVSNRPEGVRDVKALLSATEATAWHFVAMTYHHAILNRTYVVFVTPTNVCGAYVRGTLPAPVGVTERPDDPWRDPHFYPRRAHVARYVGIDLDSEAFRAVNSANFRYAKTQITDVTFTDAPKWGMGKVPYSGRFGIKLQDGVELELILLGTVDGPALRNRLQHEVAAARDATPTKALERA